jgi:hypothetical protein
MVVRRASTFFFACGETGFIIIVVFDVVAYYSHQEVLLGW